MNFSKIQLGKQGTLNVTYRNLDGTVTVQGANIVHRDLRNALRALVPHLVLLTEQREAVNHTLSQLEEQKDWEEKGIFQRMSVNAVSISDDEILITGQRILDRGEVIKLNSPKVSTVDDEKYEYLSELSLAIDNLKYEAEQYLEERKWGLKQSEIDFDAAENNPFQGEITPEVPVAVVEVEHKKRGRKKEVVA
jgi:hypothetical protein